MFIRCLKEHLKCDFALQFWFWHFKKEAFLNIISERKLSVWENIADEYGLWWHQRVGGTIVEFFKEYLSHLLIFTHSTHNLQPINFLKKCVSICEKRHLFHNNRRTERILHYSTLYMKWCVCSSSLEVFLPSHLSTSALPPVTFSGALHKCQDTIISSQTPAEIRGLCRQRLNQLFILFLILCASGVSFI